MGEKFITDDGREERWREERGKAERDIEKGEEVEKGEGKRDMGSQTRGR